MAKVIKNERSGATSKAKKTKARKNLQKMATKAYKREKKALALGASAGIKAGQAMKKSSPSSAQKAYKQGAMARNATKSAQYKVDGVRREGLTPTEKNAMRANSRVTNTSKASNAGANKAQLHTTATAKRELKKKVY